jgi:general secretion pathway protein L
VKGATKIRTVAAAPAAGAAGATLLAFADATGTPRRWRLLSGGAVVGRGDELAQLPEQRPWVRTVLAVPGTDVTMHWLELADTLTAAQASAAARLQIAESSAEPIGEMHIAAGRRENGLTAIAVTPVGRMTSWIEQARAMAMEPDVILPAPMLLMPPGEGLVRYRAPDGAPDYRGTARAFSLEDELAALLLGDTRVTDIEDDVREAGLGPVLADPPINLRQGPFARRREFVFDWRRVNWLLSLGLLLILVSLLIEIAQIVRTTFAADRIEEEARELRVATGPGRPQAQAQGGGFGVAATALFDALREMPAVELGQIVYQPDGSLRAALLADTQATIDALRARVEARGLQAAGGPPTSLGGRAAGEITIRPR